MKMCRLISIVLIALLHVSTRVKAEPVTVISSLKTDLEYDESKRLTSHYLFYPENCNYIKTENVHHGFKAHKVKGEAFKELFGENDETTGSCPAVCVERGVEQSLVASVLPERYFQGNERRQAFEKWFSQTCTKVEICLTNYHTKDHPLEVYWIPDDPNKDRDHQFSLNFGEKRTICFHSFLGHRFEVYSPDEELLEAFTVEHHLILAFGESPPSDSLNRRNVEKEITNALQHEWGRSRKVRRTFSPLGFGKGRLPDDVFASLAALYHNNQENTVNEEWKGRGVFVNWWESQVKFLQLPWNIKGQHQKRLKDMVSEWAGVEVEETVMYGLRQYQEGARLLTHVDRHNTHALSLIVNIAQGNLTEPWHVEIFDHGDRLHEIPMVPGDVVFYESAKNLHSRNTPLRGANSYYVNLFSHYRPDGEGDDWWKLVEKEPKSPPILETQGECRLEIVPLIQDPKQSSSVQTVKCDDKRLGNTVSPRLFQAHNGDDLIHHWRQTSPNDHFTEENIDDSSNADEL